jgi:hypothetical protein
MLYRREHVLASRCPAGGLHRAVPANVPQPPSGDLWLHEIKHDGFGVIACKVGKRVKLYSRPGSHLTYRFPLPPTSLAHKVSDKVQAAYRRGDLFDKRRKLMQAWADYCAKA